MTRMPWALLTLVGVCLVLSMFGNSPGKASVRARRIEESDAASPSQIDSAEAECRGPAGKGGLQ
jgi:hypothetical protein